jgi:ATP-dependent DNA ligase
LDTVGSELGAIATIEEAAMPFIPPMLATRLEDPRRLADPRYSAEPKLDGQRAQLHVRDHHTARVAS